MICLDDFAEVVEVVVDMCIHQVVVEGSDTAAVPAVAGLDGFVLHCVGVLAGHLSVCHAVVTADACLFAVLTSFSIADGANWHACRVQSLTV